MGRRQFRLFGVSGQLSVFNALVWCSQLLIAMTALSKLSARVAIRPRKMRNGVEIGLLPRGAAQNAVTNWCQTHNCCDKQLCLHYEVHEIHDFGSKSCSSWIHSSHTAPRNLANGWSKKTLAMWTNLVRLFRSDSV